MTLVRVVSGGPQGHRSRAVLRWSKRATGPSSIWCVRRFSPATVRAYAFDLANFAGFLGDR